MRICASLRIKYIIPQKKICQISYVSCKFSAIIQISQGQFISSGSKYKRKRKINLQKCSLCCLWNKIFILQILSFIHVYVQLSIVCGVQCHLSSRIFQHYYNLHLPLENELHNYLFLCYCFIYSVLSIIVLVIIVLLLFHVCIIILKREKLGRTSYLNNENVLKMKVIFVILQ